MDQIEEMRDILPQKELTGRDKSDNDGDDWSKESFDVIKRYFAENRESFITATKEASQWRSLI